MEKIPGPLPSERERQCVLAAVATAAGLLSACPPCAAVTGRAVWTLEHQSATYGCPGRVARDLFSHFAGTLCASVLKIWVDANWTDTRTGGQPDISDRVPTSLPGMPTSGTLYTITGSGCLDGFADGSILSWRECR